MLDTVYRQEYLRVRVIDNQVIVELCVHIDGEACIKDSFKLNFYLEKLHFHALGAVLLIADRGK